VDIQVWPEESAQKIKDEAANAGMPEAIDMVDRLAKIVMGNARLVEDYAYVWMPKVVGNLSAAQEDFTAKVSKVNDVWTGPAADEFKLWAGKVDIAFKDCKALLKAPRDALLNCSRIITRNYSEAIKLVGRFAAALIEVTTGILSLPIDVLGMVGDLLATFVQEAANLIALAVEQMGEFRRTMVTLEGDVAALTDLVPMGHVVGDAGGWQVRPAS
jgi:hypothetical protein